MYCKILKLTNGETIIGCTENDCSDLTDGVVEVMNPVLVSSIRIPVDETMIVESFVLQTWMRMADSCVVKVPVRNVVAVANVVEKAAQQYMQYISDQDVNKVPENEFQNYLERYSEESTYDYAIEEDGEEEDHETSKPNRTIFH